jgi:hypothetical protein
MRTAELPLAVTLKPVGAFKTVVVTVATLVGADEFDP